MRVTLRRKTRLKFQNRQAAFSHSKRTYRFTSKITRYEILSLWNWKFKERNNLT